jgi:HK97 family phage prohead protease
MLERRLLSARAVSAEGRTLSGYAAVFNEPSTPLMDRRGEFIEYVQPGAFAESIERGGQWALWNHDAGEILGRAPSTLQLRETAKGLQFELELPNTTRGNDVAELLRGGVLDGQMSFGFIVQKDAWSERGGSRVRHLEQVDLREISIVPEAAYPQTHSALRHGGWGWRHRRLRLARARSVR